MEILLVLLAGTNFAFMDLAGINFSDFEVLSLTTGNNLSGIASHFAIQISHSCDAFLLAIAIICDAF